MISEWHDHDRTVAISFEISGAALAARQRSMGSTFSRRGSGDAIRQGGQARGTLGPLDCADHHAPGDVPHSRVFAQLALPAGMALTI